MNLDYAVGGYDIFQGNPIRQMGSPDPGLRDPIFKVLWSDGQVTGDGRFRVPNGMSIKSCKGTCSTSFSSTLIAGESFAHLNRDQIESNLSVLGI